MDTGNNNLRCSWCGKITEIIWIHGHGQCKHCGTNIDECCRGESIQHDSTET